MFWLGFVQTATRPSSVTDLGLFQDNQDSLVASGAFSLSDSSPANVALFSFENNTWTRLGKDGDFPGPVTALEVNDGNSSSIFAAGKSTDGTKSYLTFWNGLNWTLLREFSHPYECACDDNLRFILESDLGSDTNISQLTMVPVFDAHESNEVIQDDRMLLLSGALSSSSFGDASSVLFDGQTYLPYIVSASTSGSPGAISGLIHSFTSFSFARRREFALLLLVAALLNGKFCRFLGCRHCHSYLYRYCGRRGVPSCVGWDSLDAVLPQRTTSQDGRSR